jgi:hypothetical protein
LNGQVPVRRIQTVRTPIEVSGSDVVDLPLQVVLPPGGIFLEWHGLGIQALRISVLLVE